MSLAIQSIGVNPNCRNSMKLSQHSSSKSNSDNQNGVYQNNPSFKSSNSMWINFCNSRFGSLIAALVIVAAPIACLLIFGKH